MADVIQIKPSDVINMLNAGKSRKEIKEHYGLSHASMLRLFQDPRLKGLKTKKQTPFELLDDGTAPVKHKKKAEASTSKADSPATEETATESAKETAATDNW